MQNDEIKAVTLDIEYVESVYRKLLKILPSFEIADGNTIPYGLKHILVR